jgi:hypothetical protein
MTCPHCKDNPDLVPDGTSVGVIGRHRGKFAPDSRPRCQWEVAGAESSDFYFLTGAVGYREFSKLLYRFIRPPALPGKPAPAAPANELPLMLRELNALIKWLKTATASDPAVVRRMRALASVLEYLRDFVMEKPNGGGHSLRCPESWAHFLYPLCMPSAVWVIHHPDEHVAILRALMVAGALDPHDAGEKLRKSVEQIAPWLVDFMSACKFTAFPSVSRVSGGCSLVDAIFVDRITSVPPL